MVNLVSLSPCQFARSNSAPLDAAYRTLTMDRPNFGAHLASDEGGHRHRLIEVFSGLSGLSARNAEPLHLRDQRRALQAEPGGCAFRASNNPVGFGQRLDDVVALGVF